MDAEITEIATRGATVLAGLMVTSAWDRVKPRVAAMFGRRAESVAEELDETQAELIAAQEGDSESAARSAQGEWEPKLRRLLANDPAMVTQLLAILDEFAPKQGDQAANVTIINNTIKDGNHQNVIQAGFYNDRTR